MCNMTSQGKVFSVRYRAHQILTSANEREELKLTSRQTNMLEAFV